MNEMKTRTVNLAEIAVVVEEHVSTSDDLSSDVLPANAARQRAQSMGTLTCDIGEVRVIVCTPPEASAHSDSIVALLTETLGATFETDDVDLDADGAHRCGVVPRGGEVAHGSMGSAEGAGLGAARAFRTNAAAMNINGPILLLAVNRRTPAAQIRRVC